MYKTRTTSQNEIKEEWYVIDAAGQRIGRVASVSAELLLAKNNPLMRDYIHPKVKVIIINAEKLDIPKKKLFQKEYTTYSGYPSGLKIKSLEEVMAKDPRKVIERAVKGMLPKNKRGNSIYASNLFVYVGDEHKHEAQKPLEINVKEFKV